MTKEKRAEILVVCARMRFASDGPDVRRFRYNDVDAVRAAFEQLAQYVDTLEAENAKLRETASEAAFFMWGCGDHKIVRAGNAFKKLWDELGMEW